MKQKDLKQLIKAGESDTAEFKASFDKEVLETSVSFANTKGGTILIGVSDKGDIKGVQIGKETLKDWSNLVSLGLFMQIGVTGKGTEYILTRHKDATKTPSGQSTRLPWREREGVRGRKC